MFLTGRDIGAKEIECIRIMQQKFGSHVVGTVKDKPWKVVIRKL